MKEIMGMHNLMLVADLEPLLLMETRGVLSPNTHAFATLVQMARHTYDWEPTARQRANHVPCRLYEMGMEYVGECQGYGKLSNKEAEESMREPGTWQKMQLKRKSSGKDAAIKDRQFLTDLGLLKMLRPQRPGRNASYLLLIGSDEENRLVEDWALECIEHGWKR